MIPEVLAVDWLPKGRRDAPDVANSYVGDLGRSFALARVRFAWIDLGGIARSSERLPRGKSEPRSCVRARSLTERGTDGGP